MTLSEFLKETIANFTAAGLATPRLDAELIISSALKIKKYKLVTNGDMELSGDDLSMLKALSLRRIEGEPAAYITGVREFYSLEFNVDKNVLIPRPETELLVDLVLFYSAIESAVLDIGTGSGAIAVALKYNRPDLRIFASDISREALGVARANSGRISGEGSVCFVCGDLLRPFRPRFFDVIVSNPPYLDRDSKSGLQREIGFEPESALFAGDSGRSLIKKIIHDSGEILNPGGYLLIEIGSEMADFIRETAGENNLAVSIFNDYSDMPRAALFRYN